MTARVRTIALALAAVLALGALGAVLVYRNRAAALPQPGSDAYEQMTRAFYWGLAALEVGLLDDARQQFEKATTIVPDEPAAWANLGLAQLRLGELDAAAPPIERALMLAPRDSGVILLAARMEEARGRLDEAVVRLREAVSIDADSIRARFALADQLQRLNDPASDAEALDLLDAIVSRVPGNIAAHVERARIAARRADRARLESARDALRPLAASWPDQAAAQFRALDTAVNEGRFDDAARATIFLRNVLAPVPAFSEGLAALRTPVELIAAPFDRFLALLPPTAEPSPADPSITFEAQPLAGGAGGGVTAAQALYPTIESGPSLVGIEGDALVPLGGSGPEWRAVSPGAPSAIPILTTDWDHDFRTDVVISGARGLRLLIQRENGRFEDVTATSGPPVDEALSGAWAADIEMDGDIDIVAGAVEGPPFVLRNNGDGTWRRTSPFTGVEAVRGFAWADLDQDADADAVFLDRAGSVHAFRNRQAGQFEPLGEIRGLAAVVGLSVADLDADGTVDILVQEANGSLRRVSWRGSGWQITTVAKGGVRAGVPGGCRVMAADLDNNGALDLIVPCGRPSVWLAGSDRSLTAYPAAPDSDVFAAADRDGDGRLDLAAIVDGRPVWLMGRGGTAGYHWKLVRPRGQASAGDQRINAFGVGGEISVRSGLLIQTQVLEGAPVHFGLGTHEGVDVTRIVWPNGNAQAEFGTGADEVVVAEQRLKGSCPWVFAWDGTSMGFVTDFLWRSPLGLRINARDTAGVTQTEDWVRIAGDRLQPHEGHYDIRITAELWETHFFDHVALLVVDHPSDTEMFVDERFRPAAPPALAPRLLRMVGPVESARDDEGRDVTGLIAERDGRHLATFGKGRYQGIASPHAVEFTLPDRTPESGATLVASGWIYPTDSSINVAIGQGEEVRPSGVALEARDAGGRWVVIDGDVGFPAGKNKTMLIDLAKARGSRRLRLRTNLEIYWDALTVAQLVDVRPTVARLSADAELRFRGFSVTTSPRGDAPETPIYARLAGVTQRWRDLTGFHTRFGNVNALLSGVDDRYVIMNAGDELRLRFPEQPAPPSGWHRDFVLIGDGWEKDGDYNTGFSQTVLPLPSHEKTDYAASLFTGALEDDPVYQRHRSDWVDYHTRYVTPQDFIRGLRQPGS